MTVAAVIVPRDQEQALADAAGRAAARRIVEIAWAGGALPLVIVVDDPAAAVAAVLAGSPARVVPAGASDGASPYRIGARAAVEAVVGTDAWLLWPGDRTWVDPETVTSLIEAHGAYPDALLRPVHADRAGWPLLVPAARFDEVGDAIGRQGRSRRGRARRGPSRPGRPRHRRDAGGPDRGRARLRGSGGSGRGPAARLGGRSGRGARLSPADAAARRGHARRGHAPRGRARAPRAGLARPATARRA